MKKISSKTLAQILDVILETKIEYAAGKDLNRSYTNAIKKISEKYGVTYQTIIDGCTRRIGKLNAAQFKSLLQRTLEGDPAGLRQVIKQHINPSEHYKVDSFLKSFSETKGGRLPEGPGTFPELGEEEHTGSYVIHFRLDRETYNKLKALAGLNGVSTAEYISASLREHIEIKLKEWALELISKDEGH
jgi:hypothetical protein